MAEEMNYDANGNATGYTQDSAVVATTVDATAPAASLKDKFKEALNITWTETTGYTLGITSEQDILANRTPDQVFDAFATAQPEWAETVNAIKAHPELRDAFYGALTKDPSMLDGLASMAADGAGANPQEFIAAINDDTSRGFMVQALDKIAEKPDDAFDFEDFKYLYDNRNNTVNAGMKLREMGINLTDALDAMKFMSMFSDAMMSPTGFRDLFNQLPEILGLTGEQAAAAQEAFGMLGNYLDLCMGTKEDGFRALANEYGDDLVEGGQDYWERISGKRDEEIAAQRDVAGTGEHVDPATQKFAANLGLTTSFTDPATGAAVYEVPAEQAAKLAEYDRQVAAFDGSQKSRGLEVAGP